MEIKTIFLVFAVALALLLLFWRFAGGRYGSVRPSPAAEEAFRSGVDPDLAYHWSGPANQPDALVALDRRWTLVKSLWQPRGLTPEGLKDLVEGMEARAAQTLSVLHGFEILDDRGGVIGKALGYTDFDVTVQIVGDHRLTLSTPAGEIDQGR